MLLNGVTRIAALPATPPDPPIKEVDPHTGKPESAKDSQGADSPESALTVSKSSMEAHIAKLRELQTAAKKELVLSEEQEAAIDGLFDAHVRAVRQSGGQRPFGVNTEDANAVEELRKKLNAAREAGDQDELRKLTSQFKELVQSRRAATGLTTDQFIAKVAAVLDKNQAAAFRKLINRMRFGDARGAPSENLTRFWRAILHPELNLSDEQRRSIHELRTKAVKLTAEARSQGKEDELPRIGADLRSEVVVLLTPEQRLKLDEMLKNPPPRPNHPDAKPESEVPVKPDEKSP